MWQSPKPSPDRRPDAGRPQGHRRLEIANLIVSVLILAVFIRSVPLLLSSRDSQPSAYLTYQVERLEQEVADLRAQVEQLARPARLEVTALETAMANGERVVGFQIANSGPYPAQNVRILVTLDAVSPVWNAVLHDISQLTLRAFPQSLEASAWVQRVPPSGGMESWAISGANAMEFTAEILQPNGTLYVGFGLPAETCAFNASGQVKVRASGAAPLVLRAESLQALQVAFARQMSAEAQGQSRIAQFSAVASCYNCQNPPGRLTIAVPALRDLRVTNGPARLNGQGAAEWDVTVRAVFDAPRNGAGGDCPDTALSTDGAFLVYPHRVFSYEFSPAK